MRYVSLAFVVALGWSGVSLGAVGRNTENDKACLRLQQRFKNEYGPLWTADVEARFQDLCKESTRKTPSGQRVLNVQKLEQVVSHLVHNDAASALPPLSSNAAVSSDSNNSIETWTVVSSSNVHGKAQAGTCLSLQTKASTRLTDLSSEIKLKFTVVNPATSRPTPPYAYVLRVDMPSGVSLSSAKAFPLKNIRFQPRVGGGMVLWEVTPIPTSMAKFALTLTFAADKCRGPSAPLQFATVGVQIVNQTSLCEARPVIPEIVVQPHKALKCPVNVSAMVSAESAKRVPSFTAYGPVGTRCLEQGTLAPLASPTVEDCFVHCSYTVPEEPSYMNYLDDGQGQPQCWCLGGRCTLRVIGDGGGTSRRRTRSRKMFLTRLRNDREVDNGLRSAASGGMGMDIVDPHGLLTGATVRDKRRGLADARFGAYEITSLATHAPTAAPTVVPTLAPTVNCMVPAIFLANFEYCEPKLCPTFLWRIKHLNASGSDLANPTAYDVCRGVCSYLTLGEPGNVETQDMRARCQKRCHEDGHGSFACQAYCTDYPTDPACPRPGCTTIASVEANLEYCSQNVCDAFFPVLDAPLTEQNQTTYRVCRQACSAQQLMAEGTMETADQRRRCRNLCVIDGIENSLMCLSYCLSFPNDTTVCPSPATVAAIVQAKTYTPSPTASPTAAPTVHCLAPEVFKKNAAFCDATQCSQFLWRLSHLSNSSSSAESKGTAADICGSFCTILTLGPLQRDANNTVVATPPQRAMCQARCEAEGQQGSFLCQSYCADYPEDPVCSLPDCTTLASVEENLEICDHSYCSALFAPKDYTRLSLSSLKDEMDLCELPCSAQRLGVLGDPVTYEATLPMRERCRARCRVEGVETSVMCLSYCLSFPSDPLCPEPAKVISVANTTLHNPDCYIPDVFAQNMAVCEKQLCDPLNWVEGLVSSNATSDPTAYDVCGGACSVDALGLLPSEGQNKTTDPILDEQRGRCRERCRLGGLESFLCRRYCEAFPSDPVCPKPDCMTFASIEANPEYCDRSACLRYLPWNPFLPVSPEELRQEEVCTLACSAQQLGPVGGLDTSIMRGHCQRLCTLSGPEGSRLCLSYCLSFPDDPVCPSFGIVQGLMARGKPPTPSPSPPVFRQPLQPLLMASANTTSTPPVLNVNQLTLGYNPFLGLEPHEQLGIYTRNEIFQFHVDIQNVFLVQAPNPNVQLAVVSKFAAPLEYLVTPELADCSYSNEETSRLATTRDDYMQSSSRSKSIGMADVDVSGTIPGTGVTAKSTLSAASGNSKESQIGRAYESQGFSKSVTTRLKRSYYRAGLRVDRFNKESFTPSFRSDARELGHRPYSFNATIEFITKYGAYVFDSVTMGASLYRGFFFTEDTDDGNIKEAMKTEKFTNVNALVSSQSKRGSSTDTTTADGTKVTFSYTDVERIGEFNTGGAAADATTEVNSCAIGASIAPQIIEYALKPLWDPQIPLELFMTQDEATNFREYLYNATVTQISSGSSCQDEFGDCYGNGGICLPKYDRTLGVYDFECSNPVREGAKGTYEYDVYVFGLEVGNYYNSENNYPQWWGHHTENLVKFTDPVIPTQYGIFGYNQAEIFNREESLGKYCPLTMSNFWNGFDYRKNESEYGGALMCDPTVQNPFTIRFRPHSESTQVRVNLASINTRGIALGRYWHDYRLLDLNARAEGEGTLRTNHDKDPIYYAQPSMGVAVCPVSLGNNTRTVAEYCYLVFKWVGSWKGPNKHIEKPTDTSLCFVAQLFDTASPFTEMPANEEAKFKDNPLYAVTKDAEPDLNFVRLSFDLLRYSDKPVNVAADINKAGVFKEPVPQLTGNYRQIRFTDLQAKLNQGLDVSLEG